MNTRPIQLLPWSEVSKLELVRVPAPTGSLVSAPETTSVKDEA